MQRRHLLQSALALSAPLSLTLGAPAVRAQTSTWPQRPVRWILSQPAGSGPDVVARVVAESLAKLWGQPVVIDNRPGGQNVIGAQAAARSPADGHAFYYGTTAAMVTNLHTFRSLPYDPVRDFAPVRLVVRSAFVLAAGPAFTGASLADAFAQARSNPGTVGMATEGPKTFSGMLADSVAHMAGVKFNHVPYTKSSDALQDVMGGRVPLVCLPEAALTSYIKAGQVRPLAVSVGQRKPDLPQVPTLAESFPGFEFSGWNGLFAPAGTAPDVVQRVARDLDSVLSQPEVAQRLVTMGSMPQERMTVAEFDAFMVAERGRWSRLVQTLGIQPE